jgi:hypothetical protein
MHEKKRLRLSSHMVMSWNTDNRWGRNSNVTLTIIFKTEQS